MSLATVAMSRTCLLLQALALVCAATVSRADESLLPPDASKPGMPALMKWHGALVSGDYSTYSRLTYPVPGISAAVQRQLYEEMRKWTPPTIRMTNPQVLPNGDVRSLVIGCVNGRRQVAHVTVVMEQPGPRVLASGWGDVWGPASRSVRSDT
jgi:hypothetical protein